MNVEKTKYSFFLKPSKKDNISLQLPNLTINNCRIKREESIKFLGVLSDENANWKEHLEYIENKCAKNIGLLYKAKHHLNKKCLLALYCSYVHAYINYANIAWDSTHFTNLKKLHSQQKHAMHIVHNVKFEHTRQLFKKNKIFNVYQLNILNNVMFLHRISTKNAPAVFHPRFQRPSHSYPTNFSKSNHLLPVHNLKKGLYGLLRVPSQQILTKPNFV